MKLSLSCQCTEVPALGCADLGELPGFGPSLGCLAPAPAPGPCPQEKDQGHTVPSWEDRALTTPLVHSQPLTWDHAGAPISPALIPGTPEKLFTDVVCPHKHQIWAKPACSLAPALPGGFAAP